MKDCRPPTGHEKLDGCLLYAYTYVCNIPVYRYNYLHTSFGAAAAAQSFD